tara:strand:- start:555 stop:680 length:126 start_codon:yes stop_codon:yes gene_type:complete
MNGYDSRIRRDFYFIWDVAKPQIEANFLGDLVGFGLEEVTL